MFNWVKNAEGYDWEYVEEADSMDTDPFGSGTYWFHLPDSVKYSDDDVTEMRILVEGDTVEFYADAYDNNSNYGSGDIRVWYVNQSWTGVEETDAALPVKFELGQNYPNPFNNSTVIPFSVDRAAEVKVSIFDVSGRLVETVFNGKVTAGAHEVEWYGKGATSGVYIYTLETAGTTHIGKMTLLR